MEGQMNKNVQICQKCAINCGIEGNASNENITKYKNLSGVKSISNSVHRLARYRIVALISIERLCNVKVYKMHEIVLRKRALQKIISFMFQLI